MRSKKKNKSLFQEENILFFFFLSMKIPSNNLKGALKRTWLSFYFVPASLTCQLQKQLIYRKSCKESWRQAAENIAGIKQFGKLKVIANTALDLVFWAYFAFYKTIVKFSSFVFFKLSKLNKDTLYSLVWLVY